MAGGRPLFRREGVYCGMVDVNESGSDSVSGLDAELELASCRFTREMNSSVELRGGSVFFSPAPFGGGITTVWVNSSSSGPS